MVPERPDVLCLEDNPVAEAAAEGGRRGKTVPGSSSDLAFVKWAQDGQSVYVQDSKLPTTIYKMNLATGEMKQVMQIVMTDRAGARPPWFITLSDDGKSYAYSYFRELSQLLVVDGLK